MSQRPQWPPARPRARWATPSPGQREVVAIAVGLILWLGVGLREADRPAEAALRPTEPVPVVGSLLFGEGLDPATAPASAWEALPGIGPARAAAIVAARTDRAFCRPGDLARATGIGPRTAERIRRWLRPPPWEERCEPARD